MDYCGSSKNILKAIKKNADNPQSFVVLIRGRSKAKTKENENLRGITQVMRLSAVLVGLSTTAKPGDEKKRAEISAEYRGYCSV